MSISSKTTICPQHSQLYEYICAHSQHSTIFCMNDFLRHCQTYGYQHYHAVRLTQSSSKIWAAWNESLTYFLNNTRQTILANGAAKVFDFIPKFGSQYDFTKYQHQLSDYMILGEIKSVSLQVIEDCIVRMKQLAHDFEAMSRLSPQYIDRSVMSDIYRFYLQNPQDYLQQIKIGIMQRLRYKATSLNIIYRFMDVKFLPNALVSYQSQRDRLIAPIYSQTVYLYNSVHHTLIPQQFSYGQTKPVGQSMLTSTKSADNLHALRGFQTSNTTSRIIKDTPKIDKQGLQRSRFRSISRNRQVRQIQRDQASNILQRIRSARRQETTTSPYKGGYRDFRSQYFTLQNKVKRLQEQNLALRIENDRLLRERGNNQDLKKLYQQYWEEQLYKLKKDREQLVNEINYLRDRSRY